MFIKKGFSETERLLTLYSIVNIVKLKWQKLIRILLSTRKDWLVQRFNGRTLSSESGELLFTKVEFQIAPVQMETMLPVEFLVCTVFVVDGNS